MFGVWDALTFVGIHLVGDDSGEEGNIGVRLGMKPAGASASLILVVSCCWQTKLHANSPAMAVCP